MKGQGQRDQTVLEKQLGDTKSTRRENHENFFRLRGTNEGLPNVLSDLGQHAVSVLRSKLLHTEVYKECLVTFLERSLSISQGGSVLQPFEEKKDLNDKNNK